MADEPASTNPWRVTVRQIGTAQGFVVSWRSYTALLHEVSSHLKLPCASNGATTRMFSDKGDEIFATDAEQVIRDDDTLYFSCGEPWRAPDLSFSPSFGSSPTSSLARSPSLSLRAPSSSPPRRGYPLFECTLAPVGFAKPRGPGRPGRNDSLRETLIDVASFHQNHFVPPRRETWDSFAVGRPYPPVEAPDRPSPRTFWSASTWKALAWLDLHHQLVDEAKRYRPARLGASLSVGAGVGASSIVSDATEHADEIPSESVMTVAESQIAESQRASFEAAVGAPIRRPSRVRRRSLLFLGDSIVEAMRGTSNGCYSALNNLVPPVVRPALATVAQHLILAIAGDQTQHVLWRLLDGELTSAIAEDPHLTVVLMIGTNNLGSGNGSGLQRATFEIPAARALSAIRRGCG